MPTLADHPSFHLIKALNIGMSGGGKTGALASLAEAGYSLWVLDYDNGLDVLVDLLRDNPAALARVNYRSIRDRLRLMNGKAQVAAPVTAFKAAGKTLEQWNVQDFTDNDVVVLDTLSTFSEAGLNEAKALANRLNERPQLQDWGWMAEAVLNFLQMLTDPGDQDADPPRPPMLPCHVIVNTHIRFMEADEEAVIRRSQDQKDRDAIDIVRGLPNAKGQEIPRNVGKLFNTVLLTTSSGRKRIISTQPQGVIEVKVSAPKSVKDTYPQETGLAQLFKDILQRTPSLTTGGQSQPTTES